MTVERWWLGRLLRGVVVVVVVGVFLVALVDLVERSRDGAAGALLVVFLRLPGLLREVLAGLVGAGVGLTTAHLRAQGALLGVACCGVSAGRLVWAAGVGVGVAAALTLLGVDRVLPLSQEALAEVEASRRGLELSVAGGWVVSAEGVAWIGERAADGSLRGVAVIGLQEGRLGTRVDAPSAQWDGVAWVDPAGRQLPLLPPRTLALVLHPRAAAEAGLATLSELPGEEAGRWRHLRLAALAWPGVLAAATVTLVLATGAGRGVGLGFGAVLGVASTLGFELAVRAGAGPGLIWPALVLAAGAVAWGVVRLPPYWPTSR